MSGGIGIFSLLTISSFVFGDEKMVFNLVPILLLNICSPYFNSISVSFEKTFKSESL